MDYLRSLVENSQANITLRTTYTKLKEKEIELGLEDKAKDGYGNLIQHWFGRYLKKIEVKQPGKVFHSFRHTFATKAVEKRVLLEYQNALGGWADYGIGQKIYAKNKNIKVMLEELSKVSYPLNKELKEFKEMIKNSFYCRK